MTDEDGDGGNKMRSLPMMIEQMSIRFPREGVGYDDDGIDINVMAVEAVTALHPRGKSLTKVYMLSGHEWTLDIPRNEYWEQVASLQSSLRGISLSDEDSHHADSHHSVETMTTTHTQTISGEIQR